MKKIIPLSFLLSLLLCTFALAEGNNTWSQMEERRRDVAKQMEAATVWIIVETDRDLTFGSGVIVAQGCVATNAHVVEDMKSGSSIYILNEMIPATRARIINTAYDDVRDNEVGGRDFALLRFDPPKGVTLPIVAFNFDIRRMDRISAWGYPGMVTQFDKSTERLFAGDTRNLQPAPVVYSEGTVNAIVRGKQGDAILHSAQIAGGNSGGPLVNARGELVGMNTWVYSEEGEGAFLNGAQPASELAAFLIENSITPTLAPGQHLAATPPKAPRPTPPPSSQKPHAAPGQGQDRIGSLLADGMADAQDRRRDVGSFSLKVPRQWSVIDEEQDSIVLGADDRSVAMGIMLLEREGRSVAEAARWLSKKYHGSKPEEDDGVYTFTYTDNNVQNLLVIGEADDDDHLIIISIAGDSGHPGVEEILDSIE